MYSPILIGSANELFRWFKEWVYPWLKRQTKLDDIKRKIYNGLGTEIDAYLKCFDDSEILFNEKITPLVESIEIAPNNNQINNF